MIALLYFQALCFAKWAIALTIEGDSLRTQGLLIPNGISTLTPTLSWRLLSESRNDSSVAFQVQAALSERSLILGIPDLWDTSRVASTDISVLYAGKTLASRSLVHWRVRAWDSQNRPSDWSVTTTFELGLQSSSDWSAQWITNSAFSLGNTSLPLFVKTFDVSCPVTIARLYALGLGIQSVLINGEEVTDEVLAPGYSNWNKALVYTTYDISRHINEYTTNVIGVELGRGIWDVQDAVGGRYMKYTAPATPLILLAQLEYTCIDGKSYTVVSDDSWKTTVDGPLIESAWYGGEEYDATRELVDWSSSKGDISGWNFATITTGPSGTLKGPQYPPLKIVDKISPTTVTGPFTGSVKVSPIDITESATYPLDGSQYVFDFGTNFAGWFSLKINETKGTRVTMWPFERFAIDSVHTLDQTTTNGPVYDAFTSSGIAQVYKPKFMYQCVQKYYGCKYCSILAQKYHYRNTLYRLKFQI